MGLTASMDIARTSLSARQEQSTIVSRNIANADNPYASRKIANTVSALGGGVRLQSITRVADSLLFQKVLVSNADLAGQKAVVDALNTINETVADPELDFSPAALTGKLNDALQQLSSGPQDPVRAKAVLDAATDLATGLNAATSAVQGVRRQADQDIQVAVAKINTTLADIQTLNQQIVNGTFAGDDVTDQLDQRDKLIADISNEIGIRVAHRSQNDVAIYTDSGVTLFDNTARQVSFVPTPVYDSTIAGNAVVVDGVPVTGPAASMPIGSGRLKGLTDVRDTYAVTYQTQLDEIARGLIETFAEQDQSGSGLPDATGIFSHVGSPTVPTSGVLQSGLAGEISVNAAVDPSRGGNLDLIRDGGINGAAYAYNTSGADGFSGRIRQLADRLVANRPFDPVAESGNQDSVLDFASTSVGWLQEQRRVASSDLSFKQTVQERSSDALNQVIGVNLDNEMTLLLEIERSYQATSRLITTIDDMYQYLLTAV
jgi:flagellar hook-associated protein 1 FlgK